MRPYYYSLNEYLKDTYGCKMYKLALNGGMTCPNRDGLIDTRGCIFCSAGGSGDFAGDAVLTRHSDISTDTITTPRNTQISGISSQIDAGQQLIRRKYNGGCYIAYFQSYTNTYAPVEYLRQIYYEAINREDIRILSIATRPDCLSNDIIELLSELNAVKPVWIELGLQTIHPKTAEYIRRGYELSIFESAVKRLNAIGIKPIVHMIIGLPFETEKMILQTANYIAHCGVSGIKLQLLHVLKNTDLAADFRAGLFQTMKLEDYIACLGNILELLPSDMVVHRLTGDGPKNLLVAPLWSADKKYVMNRINQYFKENNIYQGRIYQ